MTLAMRCAGGLMALMGAFSAMAGQVEVGGIKLDDSAVVQGTTLQLNGAGVRYKAVFKVYAAGLYVGKKVATPEEFYAATGPKRMHITMLRDIASNELGKAFTRGFEDNAPKTDMAKLVPGLIRMGQIFSDQKKLLAGEVFTIDWVPGTGTVIAVKGVMQGEPFKEVEFYNALMRIWLGHTPADWKLKESLLGKTGSGVTAGG